MITEEEQRYIIDKLTEWVAPLERPREALTAAFIGTTFPTQLGQGAPAQLVFESVRLARADEWNHNPPWLDLLLQLLPQDQMISAVREQLRHPPPKPQDPLSAAILGSNIPFVGRTRLRELLPILFSDSARLRPILTINGTSQIGKTYSWYYIEHFSVSKPLIAYHYEFDPDIGLEIGPDQLASELVLQMGRPPDTKPPLDTNQKLHVQHLASWVLNQATQTQSQHWFILDNFRGDKLRPDTRAFLVALSDRITTGVFPHYCRLILISFDRAQLTVDPAKVEEEMVQTCTLNEVQTAISDVLKRAPVPMIPANFYPLILKDLPSDTGKMIELNLRLRSLLHAISEVTQILAGIPNADYGEVLCNMLANLPNGKQREIELRNRLEALRAGAAEVVANE